MTNKEFYKQQEILLEALNSKDSSVRRAAIINLRKNPHKQAIRPLINALNDKDPKIRKEVIKSLVKIGDPRAIKPLISLLRKEEQEDVRWHIVIALGHFRDQQSLKMLIEVLQQDQSSDVRQLAASVLGVTNSEQALQALISAFKTEEDAETCTEIALALGKFDERATQPLVEGLNDKNVNVRAAAIEALGDLAYSEIQNLLCTLVSNDNEPTAIRLKAAESLGKIGDNDPEVIQSLVGILDSNERYGEEILGLVAANALVKLGEPGILALLSAFNSNNDPARRNAVQAFREVQDLRALNTMLDALTDADSVIKQNATIALGNIGNKRAIEPLTKLLNDKDEIIRNNAIISLGKLGVLEPLLDTINNSKETINVRRGAIMALSNLAKGNKRAIEALNSALNTSNKIILTEAVKTLGKIGDSAVLPHLQKLLEADKARTEAGESIREVVLKAIEQIQKRTQ